MLYHLLKLVALRHLWRKKVRVSLVFASVALGVSLFIAIRLINEATLKSFRDSLKGLSAESGLVVSAGATGFPESRVEGIEKIAGVRATAPMVIANAYLDDGRPLTILGVDLLRERGVRAYQVEDAQVDDPLVFLNQPDSILVARSLATELGIGMDSSLSVVGASGSHKLKVRGLLAARGAALAFGGSVAIMDIDGARAVFGRGDRIDRLDVSGDPGAADAISKKLGPGYRVVRPEAQGEETVRMLAAFQAFLSVISLFALLAACFLVENSVAISVSERRAEIGLLRVVGAPRLAVLAVVVAETCLMGSLAGVAGAFLGRGASSLLAGVVEESLKNQFLIDLRVSAFHLSGADFAVAIALAAVASLIAALRPAISAARVSPLEALRAAASEPEPGRLLLTVLGGARMASRHIVNPVSRLAVENLLRHARRSLANAAALSAALLLIVVISVMNASFRSTMGDWIGRTFHYDLLISSPGNILNYAVQPLDEKLALEIEKAPGIKRGPERGVYGVRFIHFDYEGHSIAIKSLDAPDPADGYRYFEVLDGPRAPAVRKLYDPQARSVLVSQNFSQRFGKKTGDHITLETPRGAAEFGVAGIINEYASPVGTLYLDRRVFKELWGDDRVDLFAVSAAEGTTPAQLKRALEARFAFKTPVLVLSNAEIRDGVMTKIDRSFAFARAIEWGGLAIALLGIFSMLLISTRERRRELGLLRAVGMSRKQLVSMIVQEALCLGALGAGLAFALGAPGSFYWIRSELSGVLGWIIEPRLPGLEIALALGAGVLLAALGGLYPAVRAARMEIVDCLNGET